MNSNAGIWLLYREQQRDFRANGLSHTPNWRYARTFCLNSTAASQCVAGERPMAVEELLTLNYGEQVRIPAT